MKYKILEQSLAFFSIISNIAIFTGGTGVNEKYSNITCSCFQNFNKIEPIPYNNEFFPYIPYDNEMFNKKQATKDINYVLEAVNQTHIDCIERLPEEISNQKEIEIKNLPEEISALKLWQAISRILKTMNDAHTFVIPPNFDKNKRLPFDVEYDHNNLLFADGKYQGDKITHINGISVYDLYEKFKSLFSYEIEEWAYFNFFNFNNGYITSKKLSFLDIDVSKHVEIKFKDKNGFEKSDLFEFVDINSTDEPFIFYNIDKEKNVGTITIKEFFYTDFYKKTVSDFFEDIARNNIKNVIVDLRDNPGGDSMACEYFLYFMKNVKNLKFFNVDIRNKNKIESIFLDNEDLSYYQPNKKFLFDGKIYIATSNGSFSSSVIFTELFSDNNLNSATIVGEILGNSPNFCGGSNYFKTPNSSLIFNCSNRKIYRPDLSKNPDRLIPDIQTKAKDAINKIYEIINEKTN